MMFTRFRVVARELTPRAGALSRMASRIGYFVLAYFGVIFLVAVILLFLNVASFVGLLVSIPLSIYLAIQFSRAAAKTDQVKFDPETGEIHEDSP